MVPSLQVASCVRPSNRLPPDWIPAVDGDDGDVDYHVSSAAFEAARSLPQSAQGARTGDEARNGVDTPGAVFDPFRGRTLGTRLVPFDLVLEHVRSRGVQGFVCLLLFFMMANSVFLGSWSRQSCSADRSFSGCPAAEVEQRSVPESSLEGAAVELAEVMAAHPANAPRLFALLLIAMGFLNSRYFLRGLPPSLARVAKVLNVLLAFCALAIGALDAAGCGASSPVEFCSEFDSEPETRYIMKLLVDSVEGYNSSVDWRNESVNETDSNTMGKSIFFLDSVSWCAGLTSRSQVLDGCLKHVSMEASADAFTTLQSRCEPDRLGCACEKAARCYLAYEVRTPTRVRTATHCMLLVCVLAAAMWDWLNCLFPASLRTWVESWRSFSTRVPLLFCTVALVSINFCVDITNLASTEFFAHILHLSSMSRLDSDILTITAKVLSITSALFLGLQCLICVVAAMYNLRVYFTHRRLLASIPWRFFLEEDAESGSVEGMSEAEAELRRAGLDPQRLRSASFMQGPYYFSVACGSLFFGSGVAALVLTIGVFLAFFMFGNGRVWLWHNAVRPFFQYIAAYIMLEFTLWVTQTCLWGQKVGFPRRPALLAIVDFWYTVGVMVTSPLMGAKRVGKAMVASFQGMLLVTNPGIREAWLLSDDVFENYISILRVERLRLEADRWGARNPKLGCRDHAADCCRFNGKLWLAFALVLVAHFCLALMFGISAEEALQEIIVYRTKAKA